jgi:hypothetical protein
MIELTEDQSRALDAQAEKPPTVVDPRTRETFVLVRRDVYERMRSLMESFNRAGWDDPGLDAYEGYRNQP